VLGEGAAPIGVGHRSAACPRGEDAGKAVRRPLLSAPINDGELTYLLALGQRLRAAREDAGWTRAQVADATGLNRKTVWRIEVGARRTRVRTLAVMAECITDSPEELVSELTELGGSSIAPESQYVDRVERRRLRRLRRIEVLAEREAYALERAALEARWAARRESHFRFREAMGMIDVSFTLLRRLGHL
jgi:transcriptional regulator with XRE-family HTH domain